jgi:ribosome-binding protein aMBF1 (putative translation factor)
MQSVHVTRDRKLTPEEAERYRRIRAQVEAEKPELIRHLQSNPGGPASWEELREYQAIVRSLQAAREARGLSREQAAQLARLSAEQIAAIEELRELNPPVGLLSSYATALGQHLMMALAEPLAAE